MKYRSVIGSGKAFFVENPADKIAALKIIMAHYSDKEYDFSESEASKVAIGPYRHRKPDRQKEQVITNPAKVLSK